MGASHPEEWWPYHKLACIPPGVEEDKAGSIPRECCLRILRSHCKKVCDNAMTEYRNKSQTNRYSDLDRADNSNSRTDYYYQAHREAPQSVSL